MHADVARDREREREVRPGRWVAAARAEAARRQGVGSISQMRLAVLIGRDRNTVTRWETSEGEVDYVVWLGVLHALGLPADWEPSWVAGGAVGKRTGSPKRRKPPPLAPH